MRQKSKSMPVSSEGVVRDIRRATRKHHAAEEKIRIVLDGLRGETSIAGFAGAKALPRACINPGRRSSWRPASGLPGTPLVRRRPTRSSSSGRPAGSTG